LRTRALFTFLLLLLFISSTKAQIEGLVRNGMKDAYNFRFESAEKTFNRIIELRPNSPEGFYRIAVIYFWCYQGSRDPGDYQVFLKFADLAQLKIDKILTKNPKDAATNYLAGNLFSFRAMAQANNNQSADAFWSSRKAVDYFDETLKINPKFYDAYLGLGLFDYAMSFVPDFLKWAVNLTGLSSDKARGFQYIKTAFKKGNTSKTEAAFHLSKIYTDYLAEYDSALVLLQDISSKFPNNQLFAYQYAISLIKNKQLDRALQILDRALAIKNKRLPQISSLAYYRKGEVYFKKNQYRLAINNYQKFLDTSKELDHTGIAALNIAFSYKFLNKPEQFKLNLALAKVGNQDLFEDSYAMQKSDQYLAEGILPIELKLVKMKNYLDAGKYTTVYDSLKIDIQQIENIEVKAVATVYLAEAALNTKKYPETIKLCNQITNLELESEKWIIPMAYLLEAKSNYFAGDKSEASNLVAKAEEENDYDFKDYIQSQIEWLKRRLR
jgi:tetratricopeptide (TPR) repeat protein